MSDIDNVLLQMLPEVIRKVAVKSLSKSPRKSRIRYSKETHPLQPGIRSEFS
jgi:hypothetical protein